MSHTKPICLQKDDRLSSVTQIIGACLFVCIRVLVMHAFSCNLSLSFTLIFADDLSDGVQHLSSALTCRPADVE